MRIFEENEQTPVIVMSELMHNTSTSVRNMVKGLALEPIPQNFEHRGRLTFPSWAPRRPWLSDQERIAKSDPQRATSTRASDRRSRLRHVSASTLHTSDSTNAVQARGGCSKIEH